MRRIENEFQHKARQHGNLLILGASDALELVERCREERVPVLDVEAYILHPNDGKEPLSDTVILTRASHDPDAPGNCWALAEDFLSRYVGTGIAFNLTLPPDT